MLNRLNALTLNYESQVKQRGNFQNPIRPRQG